MRVLVVEDERRIRTGIEKHVPWSTLGVHDVQCAESGEAALKLSDTYEPDLTISDIRLPGMIGIEMCRTLRKKFPEMQIIFISGFSDKEYLKAAIELGAVGYVEKPIDLAELKEYIARAADRVREHKIRRGTVHLHNEEELERFQRLLKETPEEAIRMLEESYLHLETQRMSMDENSRKMLLRMEEIVASSGSGKETSRKYAELISTAESPEEMRDYVRSHIREIAQEGTEEDRRNDYRIRQVLDEIERQLDNPSLSLQVLADTIYLTPAYLSALFKKKTGMTISQYIADQRIRKARELLKDPAYKLYQVSRMVGYEDANYFAKIFKKQVGVTPSEYRETRMQ